MTDRERGTGMTDESWTRIMAEVRAQNSADLTTLEQTPLVYGDHIAWAVRLYGWTDDLSHVHRVGYPQQDEPYTTCGEKIPWPGLWLQLTPALVRTMPPCRFCEAEYARAQRENAA